MDLTEYVERHEFFYDAVLNEDVSNDEVSTCLMWLSVLKYLFDDYLDYLASLSVALGILRDRGAYNPNTFSTNKSNLLCLWPDRQDPWLFCSFSSSFAFLTYYSRMSLQPILM